MNDTNCGAIGEWTAGVAAGLDDFAYLTMSTGIGGGLILGGKPYHGATGMAGEFGHLPVHGGDGTCSCGRRGCLESEASGPAIARKARGELDRGAVSTLSRVGESLTGADISRAAEEGDALAIRILSRAGQTVGQVCSLLAIGLDLQAVVIGGGVAHPSAPFWTGVRGSVVTPAWREHPIPVLAAKHRDDAPLYGAWLLALRAAELQR